LIFTARNFTLSRRTFELTEQGQVTERYTNAIEQLGSEKLDVRIGGIYALERIARDSARDHPTVMEVLSAFVREHSREQWWPLPAADESDADLPEDATRPDLQAAVTVIGRRDPNQDRQSINLADVNLISADLAKANFVGARLTRVNLAGARLTGANLASIHLWNADLSDARLSGANLTHAQLTHANLARAYLRDAKLANAQLNEADLGDADLRGADLKAARLPMANLKGADLSSAELYFANLIDVDLTGADLTFATLTDAQLTDATLTNADLTGALWPSDVVVPEGWERDTSGRLGRVNPNAGDPAKD
jgi:uncharacterized protein YjbI with pentapeptide repeats